jgi:hypothetical protein
VTGLRALAVAALVAAAAAGCEREPRERPRPAAAVDPGVPPMPEAEQARGVELCDRYVARLCACAERAPELADDCALARAQPEALGMHLALLRGAEGPLNPADRAVVEEHARAVIAACVRADGQLAPERCPRTGR